MNHTLLSQLIADGYIKVNKHPTAELFIYNYTPFAQYEHVWNEVTIACRGLILNDKDEVVARPFPKFFNFGEAESEVLPNEPFEVFEKMDGSLGIMYWIENEVFIASRGSFTSEQSARANEILKRKYSHVVPHLDRTKTYLFEIIYPENRIVLDYGDLEDLVLLAVIDTQTGADCPLENIGFSLVKKYDGIKDIAVLKELEEDNKEGFVIKYAGGFRLKVKFAEYMRIHRIVTQVSNLTIWELLKDGKSLDEVLDRVPDEFFQWVKRTTDELHAAYQSIENQCKKEFKVLESRKENALYFRTCTYPKILFTMLDGRDYSPLIWKMIYPKYQRPFSNFEES